MNVLVFVNPKNKIGTLRTLRWLDEEMGKKGSNLYYVMGEDSELLDELGFNRGRIYFKEGIKKWRWYNRFLTLRKLKDIAEKVRPDIILSFRQSVFPAVLALSESLSIPHIIAIANLYNDTARYYKYKLHKARNVLFISNDTKHEVERCLTFESSCKKFVAPYGVNTEEFLNKAVGASIPADFLPPSGNFVVGMVSAMEPNKDTHFVLRVASRVLERHSNVTFMFVGRFPDKEYERKTIELADRLGLKNNVIFAGFQRNISPFFARFDIFVHPSPKRREPMGLVLVEAMAHGKPIVASRIGGIPEVVVDGETGILCEPGNEEEFFQGIVRLIENEDTRNKMGSAGKLRAEEVFSSERFAENMQNIFREIISS